MAEGTFLCPPNMGARRGLSGDACGFERRSSGHRRRFALNAVPNNLPGQPTSFIGREQEIAEVKRLLTASRLVTLIGADGCGKTRLALQAAREALPEYPDGVWFVDLATLDEPALLLPAVA